jgi:hypothetical protein
MAYRQHVLKEMTLLLVGDKIVIDPKWFCWISLHYVILWVYLCWCMTPNQTYLISVSELLFWAPHYTLTCLSNRRRQMRIPFNFLTAISCVHQDCKALSLSMHSLCLYFVQLIGYRLYNWGIGMRDFYLLYGVGTIFGAKLAGVLVGTGGCLSGV